MYLPFSRLSEGPPGVLLKLEAVACELFVVVELVIADVDIVILLVFISN